MIEIATKKFFTWSLNNTSHTLEPRTLLRRLKYKESLGTSDAFSHVLFFQDQCLLFKVFTAYSHPSLSHFIPSVFVVQKSECTRLVSVL